MPAYNASASNVVNLGWTSVYCNTSVTSSAADDAYTSWKVKILSLIKSVLLRWWSIIAILLVFSSNSGISTWVDLFVSTTINKVSGVIRFSATSLLIITSLYSSSSLKLCNNSLKASPSVVATILAFLSKLFANL